uniref:DUF789 domain-containing protein n=1 Tax=Rhizophora mucronata TaxID=61149 RepID=A0A2P2K933_RHIMU
MLGTTLQFSRDSRENRFCSPAKSRGVHQSQRSDQLRGARSGVTASHSPLVVKEKLSVPLDEQPENRAAGSEEFPALEPVMVSPSSNLKRFLKSITPSVPAQYLSKTTMCGWKTCDVEFQSYFVLGDLWDSFKEWSAYGTGVPLILNECDSVIQYYVPYLSGIQIYGKSMKLCASPSRQTEDSDSDFRDSSSDGSSDCEPERLKCAGKLWNHHHLTNELPLRMERLPLRDQFVAHQEDDEGESLKSRGSLLFEYLEQDPPYSREPLSEKLLNLASHFPEMKTLRSCDLMASSWISVAWYST